MVRVPLNVLQAANGKHEIERNYNIEVKPQTRNGLVALIFVFCGLVSSAELGRGARPGGPVSRKPRKLFGPVKPFLNRLYLKTLKCISLKLLV